MKTSEQFSFSKLENEFLEDSIKQLNQDYIVIQIFYNKSVHSQDSHLIIHLEHKTDIYKLKQITKKQEETQIRYHCLNHPNPLGSELCNSSHKI